MAQISNSASWQDGESWETTPGGGISVSALEEEAPALTVAAIAGVTIVLLIAIIVVFVFGVLIDRRQQQRLAQKIDEVKRLRNHRRVAKHLETDGSSIANNMEDTAVSPPPSEMLQNIP